MGEGEGTNMGAQSTKATWNMYGEPRPTAQARATSAAEVSFVYDEHDERIVRLYLRPTGIDTNSPTVTNVIRRHLSVAHV